jgi:copper chaperone CopZ
VVTNALRISRKKKKSNTEKGGRTITVYVEGMMCKHCQSKVKTALENINGTSGVVVDLQNKKATLKLTENVADEIIINAVVDAGFKVTDIKTGQVEILKVAVATGDNGGADDDNDNSNGGNTPGGSVPTGDTTQIGLWLFVLVMSGSVCCVSIVKNKKRKKKEA